MTQFEKLVKEMRKAQKAIFIKPSKENIDRAKKLEHSVDKFIEVSATNPKEFSHHG